MSALCLAGAWRGSARPGSTELQHPEVGALEHVDHEAGVLVAAAPEDTLRFHMLALGALRRIPVASCQNPKATKTYIFKFRLKFEPRTKKDPRI